jgi:hypothetical protein
MHTRERFHKLIDDIKDEESLKSYYSLIQHLQKRQPGNLWNDLSDSEKEELLISYDESFDTNNLISHDQVKVQHKKWLKP